MAMEYFHAYHSYLQSMRNLSDKECGRLFRALLQYSSGEQPINLDGRESIAFDFITAQIDRDKAAYEEKCAKNRESQKARWNRQAQADVSERIQPDTDEYDCIQPYTNDTKEKEKESEKEKKKEKKKEKDSSPPIPPDGGTGENVPVSDSEKPKSPSKPKKPKEQKIHYADFVTMTETEHQKLVEKYGEVKTARMIEILNNYKGSTGKKYVSDYLTCLNWVAERAEQERQRNGAYQGGGYGQGGGYNASSNGGYAAYGNAVLDANTGGNAGEYQVPPENLAWGITNDW